MTVRVALDVSAVPPRPAGAGMYTISLARHLARRTGVELHLLARRTDERWTMLAPGAAVHAVAPDGRPARLAWEQVRTARLVRSLAPDVYHGPHYTLPVRSRVRSVVTVHDLTFFDHPEWHERAKVVYFRAMIKAAVARADAVVCVSDHTASRLRVHAHPRGELVVIPHGVDHDRFSPDGDESTDLRALARHGISPPFVAFVGTIEPRKDVPTLVRAFARIAPDHPDMQLVVAGGDGWGTIDARDAVAVSGVATRIVRPGYVPDGVVAAMYRRARLVVYPSLEEGFGLPALEALACGAPLVSTRGSAIEEVVGDAAVLVAPGDADALAHALRQLLGDDRERERLRAAGPVRAAAFTWDRSVAQHVSLYERVARRVVT